MCAAQASAFGGEGGGCAFRSGCGTGFMQTRVYGRVREVVEIPNLREMQLRSYRRFLQLDRAPQQREPVGLEALFREIFPIESFDGNLVLDYHGYELEPPRYTVEECRKLRLTYGHPLKVKVRLRRLGEEAIEEKVYLGELPRMIGGGEFVINGVERVIVSQLHRSPGIDFSEELGQGDRPLHRARIVPERGSWIELEVSPRGVLKARIDQSGKFPATSLLRCFEPRLSRNEDILRQFYRSERVGLAEPGALERLQGKVVLADVVEPRTGALLAASGDTLSAESVLALRQAGVEAVEIIPAVDDPLILDTLATDTTTSRDEALLRLYERLRPGYPPDLQKAEALFAERFRNEQRYALGAVGRFRINRKFGWPLPPPPGARDGGRGPAAEQLLTAEDLLETVRYILKLRAGTGQLDDIDHLGNRRVRTVDELAAEELRRGLLRLKRVAQERMSLLDPSKHELTPRTILQYRTVAGAIEACFGRGELSQVVDQVNPLAQLTHERRLSALGPGGLNRKRAGFEVRDVHISHYGRICPIETPEGANIGLISSLAVYATVDPYGFLVTPYRVFRNGRFTGEVIYLRADEEESRVIAPADVPVDAEGRIEPEQVMARLGGEVVSVRRERVELMDVSPRQMVSLSAALIPFLEHDDANRALMGSNMQRQAVPLLRAEPPLVATGIERVVARNSSMVVVAEEAGVVRRVSATEVVVDDRTYRLRKFRGLAEGTCLNQRPCVRPGQRVERGQVIADCGATRDGELALGVNVLVAFMSFHGYNFEDAILISSRLVRDDVLTSIHIEELECEVRETDLGREEVTADVPNVARRALAQLDETGVVRVGALVRPGDILVGKVAPKSRTELTAEEKLLRAIFGRMGEDVKNESLVVPPGVEGYVVAVERFARKAHLTEQERSELEATIERTRRRGEAQRREIAHALIGALERLLGGPVLLEGGAIRLQPDDVLRLEAGELRALLVPQRVHRVPAALGERLLETVEPFLDRLEEVQAETTRRIERLTRGDQLPPGVLELIKVTIAQKRKIKVGDKLAGRHGNKGVVAAIVPEQDMPYLEDGTPVDVVLNPLGVPSRMNVGQILETHLGWAARALGFQAISPVFDGTSEEEIRAALEEAGLPPNGKVRLRDGRTGEPFDQPVTVGWMYLLKLNHMVEDKIHARATGPYSLITQQPLGGKARFGGQRFGEMEVWALEAYGAANVLQELLTVKSDDVEGRARIYEAMVKGENVLEPGTPISFEVLTHEIKGLCLNLELGRGDGGRLPDGPVVRAARALGAPPAPGARAPLAEGVRPPGASGEPH
ncbi:MAG: DNA-directed RNA polymerase subunit beta [Planctomycetota bacterium]|nr:MAG: DNA-directed RNA polymerase subunit beta [Planctomycetota bacterium]